MHATDIQDQDQDSQYIYIGSRERVGEGCIFRLINENNFLDPSNISSFQHTHIYRTSSILATQTYSQ